MVENSTSHDDLQLTRKEQELLELLEQNPGRCFSRAFLLRRIWGYSDGARTRTVDVHVSRLRKKLESRADIAIHTVVRHGYVLEQRLAGHSEPPQLDGPLEADDRLDRPSSRNHASIQLSGSHRRSAVGGTLL